MMTWNHYCTIIFLFFFTLLIGDLQAQGCCSGGTPLSGNLDLTIASRKTFTVRFIYDYNSLGDLLAENKVLDNQLRRRITHSNLLRVTYAFNDKLALTTLFSYVSQIEAIQFNGNINRTIGRGRGDFILLGQYNLFNNSSMNLSLGAGIKLPTGVYDRTNEMTGLLLNPDLQPGTGAWDFFAIAQYTKKDIFFPRLNFRSFFNYRITRAAPRYNQQQLYKFGNELQFYFGFANSFFVKNFQFNPQLMLRYRHTQFDQINGNPAFNTGGHWGYIVPGVEVFLNQKLRLGFITEIPIYRYLDGVQLTTSFKLIASIAYSFGIEKNKLPGTPTNIFN